MKNPAKPALPQEKTPPKKRGGVRPGAGRKPKPVLPQENKPPKKLGGARPGAGRKPGLHSKKAARQISLVERSLHDGITPLEVMLVAMRDLYAAAQPTARRKEVDRVLLNKAADMAQKAAPYVHPRLQAIEGNALKPVVLENRTPKDEIEAARAIAFTLAKASRLLDKQSKAGKPV